MNGVVALTGATGFIGGALAAALQKNGWSARALARRTPPQDARLDWVHGDLHDEAALRRLVEGAAAVVHCAGTVRGASAEAFNRTNAEGTANLVRIAAAQRPAPRFLLISSLAARAPDLSWYTASKRLAEQRLAETAAAMPWTAMPWTVFRPTAVYGPGDREMRPLFAAMRRGWLPVIGRRDARLTLLHVDDLVAAVRLWLAAPNPPGGIFELHDGTPGGYNWRSLAAIGERTWRRPVRLLPVPGAFMSAAASINLLSARWFGYSPMLTPGKVRELRHGDWLCDNAPLTAALGWSPRLTLAEALRQGVETRR